MFDLTGRVAWVTGAGKGIGKAVATALNEAGARTALTARTLHDLDELAHELDGDTLILPAAVDDDEQVDECARSIEQTWGSIDILVNCAGISPTFKRTETVTTAEWRTILNVNLDGTFFCCRAASRSMLAQHSGSIINVSSVHGTSGFPRIGPYAASKGGIEALTRVLAVEWAEHGVRVNTLAPGYFHTNLSQPLMHSRWAETIRSAIPTNRLGETSELAGAAVFLASDAANYVTGTTLYVDGGWTAR